MSKRKPSRDEPYLDLEIVGSIKRTFCAALLLYVSAEKDVPKRRHVVTTVAVALAAVVILRDPDLALRLFAKQ